MRFGGRILVLAVLAAAPTQVVAADAIAPDMACRKSAAVVGACFTVRGRLSVANGTPSFRIWPVGTRRIIGVVAANGDAEAAVLPRDVESRMVQEGEFRTVYGVFTLCPLSKRRPGWMQFACIAGAGDLRTPSGTSP